jgi:dihydroflavonol-4-reductase
MTRALVTGATGFIGANVARVLLERGRDVRLLVRRSADPSNVDGLDAEIHVGDLRDAAAVFAAARGCDEVYHVGADYRLWSEHPSAIYDSNVRGTANVMEACLEHEVERVVYTSTVGTIGLGGDAAPSVPRDETSPVANGQFCGHYKRSKREAEATALAYVERGVPLVVVNPTAPIGPWDRKPTPTGKILVDFMLGRLPAYVDTGLNVVHVRDVAIGHVLAAEKGHIGERYILGHRNMSLADILSSLAKLTGRSAPKIRIPHSFAYLAALASTTIADRITHRPPRIALEAVRMAKFNMFFDPSKAIRELGLPQTPVEKAFGDALDWFSMHGYFDLKGATLQANFDASGGGRAWQSR